MCVNHSSSDVYFLSGKNHGDILRFLRTGNVLVITEIFFQNMPEQKQQSVERLVLCGCGHLTFHRKIDEISLNIRR